MPVHHVAVSHSRSSGKRRWPVLRETRGSVERAALDGTMSHGLPPADTYGNSTATEAAQKTKKSAGANRLTFVFLGSPTWARTRDLRINGRAIRHFTGRSGISWDAIKSM